MSIDIDAVLARRTDLSTFLVHLTRTQNGVSARKRLVSILNDGFLKVGRPMGHAVQAIEDGPSADLKSQRCVCFTETPLEHTYLLTSRIKGRSCQFEPYGIAFTKKQGRLAGVNPVWYLDITPGHDWLTKHVDKLVEDAIETGKFRAEPIAKLAPFIEQMGTGERRGGGRYRKEFWWEREWRATSNVALPSPVIVFAPEAEFPYVRKRAPEGDFLEYRLLDPTWSLERMMAKLAGFRNRDVVL